MKTWRRYTTPMWLFLIGCAPVNLTDAEAELFYEESAVLQASDYVCDPTNGEWTFQFQTAGWTGGGRLYVAKDSESVEQHKLFSIEAAADGSWDCLMETLQIAEDWTTAQSGSSSRWLCSDVEELSFMVEVYDATGASVADCAVWGADLELWQEVDGVTPCTEFLQPEGQRTDTGSISWHGECNG